MADTELSEETSQSLVRKPQAFSIVWDYFGLKTNKNGTAIVTEEQKPVCQTCHRSVPTHRRVTNVVEETHLTLQVAKCMQEVYSCIYVSMYICKVLCARGGNTSNLMAHLKDHHPE